MAAWVAYSKRGKYESGFHPSFSVFALALLPLQNMQRQIAITEAIAIIEGTIYFFISQSFFLYRFSFFSASIGLSFLILLIEYIMVTNTTRNTLNTAMPSATQRLTFATALIHIELYIFSYMIFLNKPCPE